MQIAKKRIVIFSKLRMCIVKTMIFLVFKYVYKSKIFGHVEYYEIINAPLFELDLASLRILKLESSTGVVEIESN